MNLYQFRTFPHTQRRFNGIDSLQQTWKWGFSPANMELRISIEQLSLRTPFSL